MERTPKSITQEDAESKLNQLLKEREFRDLWRFEYTSRHIERGLLEKSKEEERDLISDCVFGLLEQHEHLHDDEARLIHQFLTFGYGLAYAFHKNEYHDGFCDIRAQSQLPKFNSILESLPPEDLDAIGKMHQISYEHGFLALDLWIPPTDMKDLAAVFIQSYPNHPNTNLPIPRFSFVQKPRHIRGIQISVPPYESVIRETWDLQIFFNCEEKISHIKTILGDVWISEGKQTIGDDKNYQIALYVDRNECTKSYVLQALEVQLESLILNDTRYFYERTKNPMASYIDQLRLSEGMLSKRWEPNKNNIRRAVGIYLWDQLNDPRSGKINRKKAIGECIEFLYKKDPKVLELYFRNFNSLTSPDQNERFGDLGTHHQTVVREMEADYDLTEYCIENADYYTPAEVKKKK